MTVSTHLKFLLGLILSCLILDGCVKEEPGLQTNIPQFDIDLFEQNIIEGLDGNVSGYAYAINQDQLLYSSGAGNFADVSGSVPFETDYRMHVASVSKTVTATAVLHMLQNNVNVNIESKVHPYLPSNWTLGVNIDSLTFENLLTHKTGFIDQSGDQSFDDLKNVIAGGLVETERGVVFDYDNNHFALFRIIIPILGGVVTPDVTNENLLATLYMLYVNNNVLQPANIEESMCKPTTDQIVKYYSCAVPGSGDGTDHTLRGGAYGWHFNVIELAAFMAHLTYNDSILTPATRQLMDDKLLGWRDQVSNVGEHGTYICGRGGWHYNHPGGLISCIMKFPDMKVEVSVIINCNDHNTVGFPGFLVTAFDEAWE